MLSGVCRWLAVAGMLIGGAACRAPRPAGPVPVEGTATDRSSLAGRWEGRYWSEDTGRRGRVTFRLRAGRDTARGEVEMTFSPALHLYGEGEVEEPGVRRQPCTSIDIEVVRIEQQRIRGTLVPYWDPDCDCQTWTVFDGELVDDHIAGTFTSRRAASEPEVTGRWFADRQRK